MAGTTLTTQELAALDVMIAAMKAKAGGGQVPGGFIGDIVNLAGRIVNATRDIVPVVVAATQLIGAGGPSDPASLLNDAINQLPTGVGLDQLIQLRNSITRS